MCTPTPANIGGMGWGGGAGKPGVKKGPFQGHQGAGEHSAPQAMVLPTEQKPPLPPFQIPDSPLVKQSGKPEDGTYAGENKGLHPLQRDAHPHSPKGQVWGRGLALKAMGFKDLLSEAWCDGTQP